jgi:uncharacterized membrane protein
MRVSSPSLRAPRLSLRFGWIAVSVQDLDRAGAGYVSIITKILAAIVVLLSGASVLLAAALGTEPGTSVRNVALLIGAILVVLAVDQLGREFRRLS